MGNIYSKRTRAQSLTAHFGPSTSTPPESSGNQVETVTGTPENAVNNKCTLRDRIKVFDQKRQDMERKRERVSSKCNYTTLLFQLCYLLSGNSYREPFYCGLWSGDQQRLNACGVIIVLSKRK